MRTIEREVFVVGAGPTGLTCAALLARAGVEVTAITRYPGLANSPRAHIINPRTMEVFRDLGIEEAVTASAMPATLMNQVIWAESLAGAEIARRRGWGMQPERRSDFDAASPCTHTNIPQHILEPLLYDAARELGAEILFDLELIAMTQDHDRVVSTCRDRLTGEELRVVSRYAVGADGDNSAVCREQGFETVGMSALGHMVNYWVEADLSRYTAHRPGALYQVFRPGGAHIDNAMFVNVRPWNEWVVAVPYDPAQGEPSRSEGAARDLVRRYVGDPSLEVRLISTSTWTINQVHAEVMHKGRVLIAGNAAHRHPPAGGLGANTCIQDAFNLAWKLQLVVSGAAEPELLGSYTAERAPVARRIVESANRSLGALLAIPSALGLQPGQSEEEGLLALRSRFEASPAGAARRRALADAVELQDYNFNALGTELGQRYASAAITTDGSVFEPTRDEDLYYEPTTHPGSPLPHVWLERDGRRVSTLDVTGRDRFTVLTGVGGEQWRDAAAVAAAELSVPLDVVAIGPGLDADDVYGDWAARRGMAEDGCLVVRPDHHVAFRSQTTATDASRLLVEAIERAVGRR